MLSLRGCELKLKTCTRSTSITSPQAVSLRVMIRSSTVGSRLSAVAAAISMSKNAKDLTVIAITATAGHTRRPGGTASSHPYDLSPRQYVLPTKSTAPLSLVTQPCRTSSISRR
ncbi:uncharacterized protein LW93_7029 [Fusarium fujikuroi]|nr:uncharacterized protein LW93_7029 [Fusarium fujikuroi]